MSKKQNMTFILTIDAQDMVVRYRQDYCTGADYAHFAFTSPYNPPRRIPVSETGYRSHFSPMHEIEAAPDVEAYARALALALINTTSGPEEEEDVGNQMTLF